MFIKKLLIICVLLILSLNASEKGKVTLYLDWLNQFQFAGYYIAKEKGYYSERGIEVDIVEYSHTQNITNQVIENNASYGIGKSSLIVDKFNGNNIILLSSIFQNSPLVLIALENSNIKNPKDLINKRVMITGDAKETASINAMIVSQGVSLDNVEIQDHSFNLDDLINGNTDAMASYLSNEPFKLKQKNIKYNLINPHDYGFDFYEGILFTSQKELVENPIRVQSFNQASLKGWEYAFNNIDETAKILYDKYNTQNKSLEALVYEGKILKELSKIDNKQLGEINPQTLEEIKRFFTLLGLNNKNSLFDTKNILFNKKGLLINEEEKEYLKENQFTLLVEANKVPFSFKNPDKIIGIEIDFWNLISKKLSRPFNIEEVLKTEFLNIFSNSVKVKFAYSSEKINSDRYIFSDSISQIPVALATKTHVNYISDLSSLKDITIGVLGKLELIQRLKKDYPNIKFEEISNIENGIYKLKNDELFGLIDDLYTLSHSTDQFKTSTLKINNSLEYKINIFLQTEKKNENFIKLINKTINNLSEKERSEILNNYQLILYHQDIDFIYILQFLIPLLILLAVFIFFNYRLKIEIKTRKETEKKLSLLANNDGLTNIFNRRKIEELCENELKRTKRYNNNLSLIFFDLNDFKIINDLYGHHIGDDVLVKITNTVSENIRSTDYFGRWGGDEFLIILPQTDLLQTKNIIITLEKKINDIDFTFKLISKVSCSFGLSQYEENDTLDSLLKRADDSMYIVKNEYKDSKKSLEK